MIRQAHTYLAGAVSGTALVAAAVVAFVLLVSFQALRDWPLAGISIGGDDSAATGPPNPADGSPASSPRAGGVGAATGPAVAKGATRAGGTHSTSKQDSQVALDASPTGTAGSPTAEAPPSGPTGQGGGASAPNGSPLSGSGSSSPAPGGGGGGGGGSGTGSSTGGGSQSTSGAVTGAVDKTVSGVDEASGGVVGSTGVTEVTEGVVNGVAGPESTVGQTVDEVGKTVNCLVGCK
jgi:hypothetical protein